MKNRLWSLLVPAAASLLCGGLPSIQFAPAANDWIARIFLVTVVTFAISWFMASLWLTVKQGYVDFDKIVFAAAGVAFFVGPFLALDQVVRPMLIALVISSQ